MLVTYFKSRKTILVMYGRPTLIIRWIQVLSIRLSPGASIPFGMVRTPIPIITHYVLIDLVGEILH